MQHAIKVLQDEIKNLEHLIKVNVEVNDTNRRINACNRCQRREEIIERMDKVKEHYEQQIEECNTALEWLDNDY